MNERYFFAIVEKETGRCCQTINSGNGSIVLDDEIIYSVPIPANASGYLNKYHVNGVWYSRAWNEFDADGNPVESAGYVDTEWTP